MTFLCLFSQDCSLLSGFVWSTWESSSMAQPSVPRPIGPPVVGGLVYLLHLRLVREGEFASLPHLCLEKKGTLVRKAQKAKGINSLWNSLHWSYCIVLIYLKESVCKNHYFVNQTILIALSVNDSLKRITSNESLVHGSGYTNNSVYCWFNKKKQLMTFLHLWTKEFEMSS